MTKKTKFRAQTKAFKIVILLLTFIMVGILIYTYKLSDRSKSAIVTLRKEKSALEDERNLVIADLEKSKIYLEQALSNKSQLSEQLNAEKEKVDQLLAQLKELKDGNIDGNVLDKYKKDASERDAKITMLIQELNSYKKKVDSTTVVLNKERKTLDTLKTSNKKLATKINEAGKLYFYNLQTNTFKAKSSGAQSETDRASKVDIIKVSFVIAENNLAKASAKQFYIQIIDSKNNVIGSKETETFGDQTLTYSGVSNVKYENKTIKVEQSIPVKDLEKGNFFINVFDKSQLVLKSSFVLK